MRKRLWATAFIFTLTTAFAGCAPKTDTSFLEDIIRREKDTSVYEKIGDKVQISDVYEENGRAFARVDGKTYQLGMDFLSMAMVYNVAPCAGFPTSKDAYNEWWRLYMQRWNLLLPELPLYSNQYYDIYNGKIDVLKTTPYFSVSDAIVQAKVLSGENAVVLGSNTDLTGAFRDASFGKASPASSDLAVQTLTSGYATVVSNPYGSLVWAGEDIVEKHEERTEENGEKTFTITLAPNLRFSNGREITAENYLVSLLVGSCAVMKEAGGKDTAGLALAGYEAFKNYDGTGEPVPFSGVRMLDKRTFSVRVKAQYAQYYYALKYGTFTPAYLSLYLGDYRIKDDGRGAYIEKGFYRAGKDGKKFAMSDTIKKNLSNLSANDFAYSGPYFVERYDAGERRATLRRNPYYIGDIRGKPSIERISYVKIVPETQLDQLRRGQVDVLASVTGGTETKSALSVVDGVRFKETHYDRAGYGKLAFRCDFSPTQFQEVRQAVAYTVDRNEFAQTFTGGYGSVVDAPYYAGSETYGEVKERLKLSRYPYSVAKAKECLRAGGWVYNADGSAYDERVGGVRYKKLSGYEKSYENLGYASVDNQYRTVKVNGEYYMPLVINWMGTQPNPVTDQLITAWQTNPNAGRKIGAYITYSSGDMSSALYGEYYQKPAYGFRRARYGAVNFATGFTSAVYDQSYYWTIDRDLYANYSSNFLMDEADFWENYGE